jgi:hypothetical protein
MNEHDEGELLVSPWFWGGGAACALIWAALAWLVMA